MAPAHLLALSAEVLLIILGELYEIRHFPAQRQLPDWDPGRMQSTTFRCFGALRPISLVNQQLRLLCLPILFKITRCTCSKRFQQLSAKCAADGQFAGLIKELDVVGVDTLDGLPEVLPHLTSLTRLDLKMEKVDTRLLAVVNAHPTLATVAVRDSQLERLVSLPLSIDLVSPPTDLPFSKILVSTTTTDLPALQSEAFRAVVQRGARLPCLCLHEDDVSLDDANAIAGLPVLPDLEQLHLDLTRGSIQSWLPSFARRHPQLRTITLAKSIYHWSRGPEVSFVAQFLGALSKEGVTRVLPSSLTIERPASWTSLSEWDVVQLKLPLTFARLVSATEFSAIMAATMLAPRLSSLHLILPDTTRPIHIDDFAKAFQPLQCLHTPHLTSAYGFLHVNKQTPWAPSKRDQRFIRDTRGTSICVTAFDTLRWYVGRIVQEVPTLELVHISDRGQDGMGRFSTSWALKASFRVRANAARDLETLGTPELVMDPKYLPTGKR
ncbi:hypothetical protein MVEN_01035600 [Mycena venus]|uniref:F-box domain-containing protein n=1 Tax=Mycena venus TaxID=2733690 RepID=A0A8H6YFD0_9AGAR|nr:hypothetical protein MVEN_01035600 [Mycena venus]